jgi:hypothetical protein
MTVLRRADAAPPESQQRTDETIPDRSSLAPPAAILVLAAFGVAVDTAYALLAKTSALFTEDSSGYVHWDPIRSPAYPAFLWVFRLVSPDYDGIRLVQGGLLVLATCCLAWSVQRLTGRTWPARALGCAILSLTPLWKWAGQVRPEILFIALTLAFFAAAGRALISRSPGWAVAAGTALGSAILIRPAAMGLLPALLLLAVLLWRRTKATTAIALIAPALVIVAACVVGNGLARGFWAPQAFGGLTLLAKTAPVVPAVGVGDPFSEGLAAAVAPLRTRIETSDGETLYWISRQGYDVAFWDISVPWLRAEGLTIVEANAQAMRIALDAIERDPSAYLRLVVTQLAGMWTWPWITTEGRIQGARAALASADFAAFLGRKAKLSDLVLVSEAAYGGKIALSMLVLVVCTALPLLAALDGGQDPLLALGGSAGLAVHGYNALVGAVQFADNRYAYALLPVVLLTVTCALTQVSTGRIPAAARHGNRRSPS